MDRVVLISPTDVKEWFSTHDISVISVDTETSSLDYMSQKVEGISICNGDSVCYIDLYENPNTESIVSFIKKAFIKAKILVGHNIKFDLKVLNKYGIPFRHCQLFCTMVADHLIDETRRHGLKVIAETQLDKDVESYKEASKNKKSPQFYAYALNDAEWTWELMQMQRPLLTSLGLEDLFREIEMPFQFCLVEMETVGVYVDKNRLEEGQKELQDKLLQLTKDMLKELGVTYQLQVLLDGSHKVISPINFNSSQQLGDIMFNKYGLEPVEFTKTSGAPSTGAKTIAKYRNQNKFMSLLYEYKIVQKLLSAFFSSMLEKIDGDGRIRPNFNDVGTKTGRLSSSKPNLQQIPREKKGYPSVRKCFIAPPGTTMIACDYSGQELRVLTQITQEPHLIDMFNKGKDLHLATANDFFNLNIPEEELFTTNEQCEKWKEKFKDERNKAKIINFGIAYGKGSFGFSKDFGISEAEAQSILDKYFGAYPKVKEGIEACHQQVREAGEVRSLTGRYRHFTKQPTPYGEDYTSGAFRQAFNFLIQGYSADMIRMAAVACRKVQQQNPHWELKMIMTIHDECVFQVREDYAEDAAKDIKEAFENVLQFSIPIIADVSYGMNYSEVK